MAFGIAGAQTSMNPNGATVGFTYVLMVPAVPGGERFRPVPDIIESSCLNELSCLSYPIFPYVYNAPLPAFAPCRDLIFASYDLAMIILFLWLGLALNRSQIPLLSFTVTTFLSVDMLSY